jgi:hypothetical protein
MKYEVIVIVSLRSREKIMRKTLISSLITATLVGLMAPSSAMAVRDATTAVGKLCEVQATPEAFTDQLSNTPSTSALSTTSCNLTASGTTVYNGVTVNTMPMPKVVPAQGSVAFPRLV